MMDRGKQPQIIQDADQGKKAFWNDRNTHIFCDVCLEAITLGHRPTTHFTKEGWQFVSIKFVERTGCFYNQAQMKNKWDQLKAHLKLWIQLKGKETGLGWDENLNTITAEPEWWDDKIKTNKEFKKFRDKGVEPGLEYKLRMMFGGTMATGEYVVSPSSLSARRRAQNAGIYIVDEPTPEPTHEPPLEEAAPAHDYDLEGSGDSSDQNFLDSLGFNTSQQPRWDISSTNQYAGGSCTGGTPVRGSGTGGTPVGGYGLGEYGTGGSGTSGTPVGGLGVGGSGSAGVDTTPPNVVPQRRKKMKKKSQRPNVSAALRDQITALIETMNTRRAPTITPDVRVFTITECLQAMYLLPGITSTDRINATMLFENPALREIFMNLTEEDKLLWLRVRMSKMP